MPPRPLHGAAQDEPTPAGELPHKMPMPSYASDANSAGTYLVVFHMLRFYATTPRFFSSWGGVGLRLAINVKIHRTRA